jgi:glycosyltransferase involved in cell wall biosynthesis
VRISVVLPTYKRPESLRRCLDALLAQRAAAEEILVVVRYSDEAARALVASYPPPVRLVPVEQAGVIAAMNAGAEVSTGEVVALTDDDAAPHPDWLARMAAIYEQDARIAAVGGRDWVYKQGILREGAEPTVGTISMFGRVTGNHHLGVGAARDVDVLKGANLSVRGEPLRRMRFDERLIGVGTEHHWELSLCLTLRRAGFRIVYDPSVGVDHHPQPRVDDSRQFSSREVRDAAHNETLAILEYLPGWRRCLFLMWAFAIGTRTYPGVAQLASALARRKLDWAPFAGAQQGLFLGIRSYRRARHKARLLR